jgi:hypothetical protein
MPVPWAQIVRLMPSILELSRDLLKGSRRPPLTELPATVDQATSASAALAERVRVLEENERRQAELVTRIADQLAQLTNAITTLHLQTRRLFFGVIATALVAVVSVLLALR